MAKHPSLVVAAVLLGVILGCQSAFSTEEAGRWRCYQSGTARILVQPFGKV